MNKDTIKYLFKKYLAQQCTEEEKVELYRWIQDSKDDVLLQEICEQIWDGYEPSDTVKEASQGGLDKIWINLQSLTATTANNNEVQKARSKWILSVLRWSAAAILVLAVGIGGYWLTQTNENQQSTAQNISQDITPGGNKATLTLADGSTIALTTMQDGTILQQQNASITKNEKGLIAYNTNATNSMPSSIAYNTITTPKGGIYSLKLSDGTKVWLNAGSSLRYPTSFVGDKREVEMTGECYFEVAHNASKPFYVKVGAMSVKVLGTHFNIKAYSEHDETKVTLLEGKVGVKVKAQEETLLPGQQIQYSLTQQRLTKRLHVNTEEAMAWHNGLFYFAHTDLVEIMTQVGRWYNLTVTFEAGMPHKEFTGKISRNENLSNVLQVLQALGIHFKIQNQKLFVYNL